jgi:DnaK suppressor protein
MPDSKKTTASKKPAVAAKKPAAPKSSAPSAGKRPAPKAGKSAPATTEGQQYGSSARAALGDDSSYLGFEPYQESKGEEYMGDAQSAHFRRILLSWKRALMEEVDRTLQHMQEDVANYADPNDRASQESDFTLELRARDRERKLIKKIDEALTALDEGNYGYCESCGCEIGIRRLEARPTATLCIDCKTLDEIREKQRAG